jgi:hypothetical protein
MSKNEDFGLYLADKYTNIFKKPLWIECNEGWYDIVDRLSKEINDFATTLNSNGDEQPITVVQIKEKFGGLRYYLNYYNLSDETIYKVEQMVREAEKESGKSCEDCGAPAEMCSPRKYWMKTICIPCREKYDMGDTPNGI